MRATTSYSNVFDDVYQKYAIDDPSYSSDRYFYGILKDLDEMIRFFECFQPFREFIGPCGDSLPFFVLYPSCIESIDFVSLMSPYHKPGSNKYIGHTAIRLQELHNTGLFDLYSLSQLIYNKFSCFGMGNIAYYSNKRATLFPERL